MTKGPAKEVLPMREGLIILASYFGAEMLLMLIVDALGDHKRSQLKLARLERLHEETRIRVFILEAIAEATALLGDAGLVLNEQSRGWTIGQWTAFRKHTAQLAGEIDNGHDCLSEECPVAPMRTDLPATNTPADAGEGLPGPHSAPL